MNRIFAAALTLVAAAPVTATAMTIENAGASQLKLSVDGWIRFVDVEKSVEFLPVTLPVTVYAQFPQSAINCDVSSQDAEVRLTEEGCWIDGALAAEPRFRF